MDTLNDLKQFYEKIIEYKKLLQQWNKNWDLSDELRGNIQSVRTELQRGYARLENTITLYGGTDFEQKTFRTAFDSLLSINIAGRLNTLNKVIKIVNNVIGKLESFELSKTESQTNLNTPQKIAIHLFDAMKFHQKVIGASRSCFISSNYREAILNAFISLTDYIKEISGLDLDGDDLMNNVFSFNYDKEQRKITKYPIICINELKNRTDRDEQQGFMFLCKGAAAFVRNPKAHKLIVQTDPLHTLEYLAFASMLFKQLDKRVQIHHKE